MVSAGGGFACGLSNDHFDGAQDLVQETFVRAYAQLHTVHSSHFLGTWLATLMRRLAASRYAQAQRCSELLGEYTSDDAAPVAMSPPGQTPEEAYMSHQLGASIDAALQQLTTTLREIFTAFHSDGRSIAEISATTDISIGAVKARLFQSRKKLRKELQTMAPEQIMLLRPQSTSSNQPPRKRSQPLQPILGNQIILLQPNPRLQILRI